MDLQKLNPWNWFKHEETQSSSGQIPVKREANEPSMPVVNSATQYPILRLHQDIDRLFDETFRGFGFPSLSSKFGETANALSPSALWPSLNVSSDNEAYQISVEAPGLTDNDFSIEVKGDVLTIQGQKQEETENKDRHFYRIERSYGAFQRTLALPEDARIDDIRATLKNGLLQVMIPRKEIPEGSIKQIPVKT